MTQNSPWQILKTTVLGDFWKNKYIFTAFHVPGKDNLIAYGMSRSQVGGVKYIDLDSICVLAQGSLGLSTGSSKVVKLSCRMASTGWVQQQTLEKQ